ncbi:hypothetical protein P9D43_01585 [Neobacillus niacini]|uniref:hypothetical protein n=1 Tax=Neobacillus niacini TaxID=86668 RepID=UPI0007AB802E|nr:hypothetical protein [Neobacillus niacini]MEC1520722.1 hypothetical protein [Neobacillus niacini]
MKVVLAFLKMRWKYVLTALIALSIGATAGPSQDQVDKANAKVDELKKQLSTKTETVASLETKNKDLQAKLDEAAPWFKMQEDLKQMEAEAKAAEEKRLAEEKAKQEEAAAKAEADSKAAEEQQITADKVQEIISDYSYVVNNVSFKNGEINATIELAPMEQFSAKDLAVNEYSSLSDELLNYEGWQVLTVTYPGAGTISMNRNEKETNSFGDYFPTLKIEERLN